MARARAGGTEENTCMAANSLERPGRRPPCLLCSQSYQSKALSISPFPSQPSVRTVPTIGTQPSPVATQLALIELLQAASSRTMQSRKPRDALTPAPKTHPFHQSSLAPPPAAKSASVTES